MPLIVDHDERRQIVAAAVGKLVAKSGVQSVTIRATAKEAGFSTAVVSHYFHSKEDLISYTYLSARDRTHRRVEAAINTNKSIFECLAECLPTNSAQLTDWIIWFGLWGMASGNEILKKEQSNGVQDSYHLFESVLKAAIERQEIAPVDDIHQHAERLMVVVNGIASLAVQLPNQWPKTTQLAVLKREIAPLLTNQTI